jgi:hypothetical protein
LPSAGTGPRIDNFNPILLGVSPFLFNNNHNGDTGWSATPSPPEIIEPRVVQWP